MGKLYEMVFMVCLQSYEARIDALQKQVEEQSMTMSMYSSYSPEDFHQEDNDIFGEGNFLKSTETLKENFDEKKEISRKLRISQKFLCLFSHMLFFLRQKVYSSLTFQ